MSDVCPCRATEYQSESKIGNQAKPEKYSGKKVVFCTNLEQMFKLRATDLDAAENDVCAQKCQVAAASTTREIRSSSESTSHRHLRSLDWKRRANGLATQVTGHHTNGILPIGPH